MLSIMILSKKLNNSKFSGIMRSGDFYVKSNVTRKQSIIRFWYYMEQILNDIFQNMFIIL